MGINVTLRVSGIDLDDPATGTVLGERFPTLLWQGEDNDLSVTFEVSEHDAPADVLETVRALECSLSDFHAVRVDRDLVSTSDIGIRVGVSREAARKWGKESDFPAPFATVSSNKRVWLWAEVLAWLEASRGIDMGEHQLTEAEMVQIDNCLMRNPDATTVRWQSVGSYPSAHIAADFGNVVHMAAWRKAGIAAGRPRVTFSQMSARRIDQTA